MLAVSLENLIRFAFARKKITESFTIFSGHRVCNTWCGDIRFSWVRYGMSYGRRLTNVPLSAVICSHKSHGAPPIRHGARWQSGFRWQIDRRRNPATLCKWMFSINANVSLHKVKIWGHFYLLCYCRNTVQQLVDVLNDLNAQTTRTHLKIQTWD